MRKVEVVPYKKEWSKLFHDECQKLEDIFGPEIIELYHIGSTAIPAIQACNRYFGSGERCEMCR